MLGHFSRYRNQTGVNGISGVEVRDAAEYPTMPRRAPPPFTLYRQLSVAEGRPCRGGQPWLGLIDHTLNWPLVGGRKIQKRGHKHNGLSEDCSCGVVRKGWVPLEQCRQGKWKLEAELTLCC